MINTSSETFEAQEKTQKIKPSPSMKIGTKPYARSRRNELTVVTECRTERWTSNRTLRPDAGQVARQTGDRILDRTLAATDRTQDSSVRSITVRFLSGKSMTGRVRWQATGRWPASDQYIAGSTVDTTGRVRSGRFSVRSVVVSWEFDPNGYFLSGAYKYNPQPII